MIIITYSVNTKVVIIKCMLQMRTRLYRHAVPGLQKAFDDVLAGKAYLCLSPLTKATLFFNANLYSRGPKAALHWFSRVGQFPM